MVYCKHRGLCHLSVCGYDNPEDCEDYQYFEKFRKRTEETNAALE